MLTLTPWPTKRTLGAERRPERRPPIDVQIYDEAVAVEKKVDTRAHIVHGVHLIPCCGLLRCVSRSRAQVRTATTSAASARAS